MQDQNPISQLEKDRRRREELLKIRKSTQQFDQNMDDAGQPASQPSTTFNSRPKQQLIAEMQEQRSPYNYNLVTERSEIQAGKLSFRAGQRQSDL